MSLPSAAASASTQRALELETLLEVLAQRAASDLGAVKVRALEPARSTRALEERRALFEDADRLVPAGSLVPAADRAFEPLLDRLANPTQGLEGAEMVALAGLLRISEQAKRRIAASDPPCPNLAGRASRVADLQAHIDAIDRALDGRGNVRDDASPFLVKLRSRIHGVRDRLYSDLGKLADQQREHLSEDTIPMRGGRLVLIMQSGAPGQGLGLTHGRSGTGRSVYFEPLEVVPLNNQLQQAVEDEEAERRRVLRELSDQLRTARDDVRASAQFVADLDLLQVLVRYRQATDGRLATLSHQHDLVLVRARHPLLDPQLAEWREQALGTPGHRDPVVPLEIDLDADRRMLVVTGPNAGGKTVSLKTVGLLALTHLCGLPIPATAGSRIPFLRSVVATVGDEQDLLADRSTFSGRLMRLREAWESADEDALILVDELGSGTDPEEGSALSVALVEHLTRQRCLAIATTHLTRVAAAAMDLDGAQCAAMAFDRQTGGPTYRLQPGPPGGSEAIALGRRLGLPASWLARADELMGPEHRDLRRMLAEVASTRQALERARGEVEREREDLALLRRRSAEREAELADEKKRVGRESRAKLEAFRLETKKRFTDEVEKIRRTLASPQTGAGKRRRLAAEATENMFAAAPEVVDEPVLETGPVVVGGPVRHAALGWRGTLEKLDRGKAQVRVGGKLLRCAEADLVGDSSRPPSSAPKARSGLSPRFESKVGAGSGAVPGLRVGSASATPGASSTELMLVGQRVEPALERLDKFIDQALLDGKDEVRVVHGYGSGRLRQAVRECLRRHRAVASHRAGGEGEGGDGATVAALVD